MFQNTFPLSGLGEVMEERLTGQMGCFLFSPNRSNSPRLNGKIQADHTQSWGAFWKRRLASASLAGWWLNSSSPRPVCTPGSRVR